MNLVTLVQIVLYSFLAIAFIAMFIQGYKLARLRLAREVMDKLYEHLKMLALVDLERGIDPEWRIDAVSDYIKTISRGLWITKINPRVFDPQCFGLREGDKAKSIWRRKKVKGQAIYNGAPIYQGEVTEFRTTRTGLSRKGTVIVDPIKGFMFKTPRKTTPLKDLPGVELVKDSLNKEVSL